MNSKAHQPNPRSLLSQWTLALALALPIACQGQEGQGSETSGQDTYMPAPSPDSMPKQGPHRSERPEPAAIIESQPIAHEPANEAHPSQAAVAVDREVQTNMKNSELATFGAGCYWCVEAVLEQVDGVENVVSGFMGGADPDVTYEEVCTGRTGHAEVVQVTFDPQRVTYEELLDWFWRLHDPTTLNRQGADRGTQYRSAIFFHTPEQEAAAIKSMAAAGPNFATPIVTEITAASLLITAPTKHQDFYRQNKSNGYCRAVIAPKLKKLKLKE